MLADRLRPVIAEMVVADLIARIDLADRIHEMRQVARHHVEKAVGRVVVVLRRTALPERFFDQLAQRRRCAATLAAQPFPSARQHRHLLLDPTERRTAPRTWPRSLGWQVGSALPT